MNIVVDNVPMIINLHTHYDKVVYKNSGGGGSGGHKKHYAVKFLVKLFQFHVEDGAEVKKGDVICTLESMKMQVAVKAHTDGVVRNIKAKDGATVAKGDVITDIE